MISSLERKLPLSKPCSRGREALADASSSAATKHEEPAATTIRAIARRLQRLEARFAPEESKESQKKRARLAEARLRLEILPPPPDLLDS